VLFDIPSVVQRLRDGAATDWNRSVVQLECWETYRKVIRIRMYVKILLNSSILTLELRVFGSWIGEILNDAVEPKKC